MSIRQSALGLLLVALFVVSACSPAGPPPEAMVEEGSATTEIMVEEKSPSSETMMEEEEPAADEAMEEVGPTAETAMEEEIEEPAPEAAKEMEEPTVEAMLDEESDMAETMGEPDMPEASTAEPMVEEAAAAPAEAMADEAKMVTEAWYGVDLVDVNTGEAFRVADFEGKVVLVETMAVWCTTCLRQQREIQALHQTLGERDDLVSLALDIDPNETPEILKGHADRNGFNWRYAVAPAEVAREIDQLYGTQFLNPPSAPMFIIDGQGQVHPLPFGVKSAQVLQEALEPFLN